ncbi:MAG: sialate O-acetylesterase [Clostridiaceae bacterium]|nr:sialate O-acetylesterase [Clostridiaceae bacterium]
MAANLSLPSYFQSGMVLQQQVPFKLRGRALSGAQIFFHLERQPFDGRAVSPLDSQYGIIFRQQVQAGNTGFFEIEGPLCEASFDPYSLTLESEGERIVLDEVRFGEVWIAGGQSNMQMPLSAVLSHQEIEDLANVHYVRVLSQSATGLGRGRPHYAYHPADDLCEAVWLRGDQPQDIAGVSAVGFAFARSLHLELKIPVAFIETALGGSCIHAWISRPSLESEEAVRQHVVAMGFYRDEQNWDTSRNWETTQYQPAALFNSKIAPLAGLGARGVLWYQGESDVHTPQVYRIAFHKLVGDWNEVFTPAQPEGLAFLIVQLAPYWYGDANGMRLCIFNEMLAAVRHSLGNPTAILPVYDLPLDYAAAPLDWRHPLHPLAKLPVGQRLARIAQGLLYKRKAPASAPECVDIEVVGNKMLLSFSQIGEGLRLTGGGERLNGFAICGPDRQFRQAQARILYGVRVMVWHDQIRDPQAVTYAFQDMNQEANLISRDQLPVVPFRSDRFQSEYSPPLEWTHCESLRLWCTPDASDALTTGYHPRWRVVRGQCEIGIETVNKTEGDGAFLLHYQTDEQNEVALEPLLHYASLNPPLDLSAYDKLTMQIFNAAQHMKHARLAIAAGAPDAPLHLLPERPVVLAALRWQTIGFKLSGLNLPLEQVRRLVLIFEDKKKRGELYIDQICLTKS